jgi:hypothetical protein
MGTILARRWAAAGHTIALGSRDRERASEVAAQLGEDVRADSIAGAGAFGDVVVLAVPWYAWTDVQREIGTLDGKVVIDPINPLMSSGSLAVGHKTSAAEMIAADLPRARVAKAFNHVYFPILENPDFGGEPADLFYCTDDDRARNTVAVLAEDLGFRPIYCGPLKMARHLEPLAALWIQMAFHFGRGPNFTFKLIER